MNDFSKFKEYPSGPHRTIWCISRDKRMNDYIKQMFEDITSNTEDQSSKNAIQTH